MKRHLPNAITCLNLVCGFLACIYALNARADIAAYLIAAGAAFDLFDGMVARALGVSSPIGKQLDSLADMVSFGVAPALIARECIIAALQVEYGDWHSSGWMFFLQYAPLIIVVCSALRLAKFNVDETQSVDFKGLPTPANALFWLAIPLSIDLGRHAEGALSIFQNPIVLSLFCLGMGLFMVSSIRLFSLKLVKGDKGRLIWQVLILIGALIGFILFRFAALPMVIVLYLLLSLIRNLTLGHEIQS